MTIIHESVNQANLERIRNILVKDYRSGAYPQQYANYDVKFKDFPSYIRVESVDHGKKAAVGFICKKTGNLVKAASFSKPAKDLVRGNIATVKKLAWTGLV